MNDQWEYQVRINMDGDIAKLARSDPDNATLRPLMDILDKHRASLKCQYDAFAGYVAEAETHGVAKYPLYSWTKETIEDPVKKAKYIKAFTLYVDGNEVYAKVNADALEADLQPLVGGALITQMSKHDTNPANNPQPPARHRS
jgi:hypothetical protein